MNETTTNHQTAPTAAPPTLGVGAIVVRDGHLLMVRRAQQPALGLWSVPGGKVERSEYLADALRREVEEETGLKVDVGDLAGYFEVIGDDSHYVIMDFRATYNGADEPRPGDDVDRARWVPLDDIALLECTPRFVELLTAWGVLS
ncbi:MAG: NUDIX hydrolase [Actinomycetota bacterium]